MPEGSPSHTSYEPICCDSFSTVAWQLSRYWGTGVTCWFPGSLPELSGSLLSGSMEFGGPWRRASSEQFLDGEVVGQKKVGALPFLLPFHSKWVPKGPFSVQNSLATRLPWFCAMHIDVYLARGEIYGRAGNAQRSKRDEWLRGRCWMEVKKRLRAGKGGTLVGKREA